MLSVIKEYRRKKALAQLAGRPAQKAVIHNFEAVKDISFVFALSGASDLEQLDRVIAFLQSQGKHFTGVVVEQKKSFANDALREEFRVRLRENGISFLAIGDMDWIGVPKNSDFIKNECSLFITLVMEPSFTVNWIVLKANSECIVGMANNPKLPYTFVLEPDKGEKDGFSYAGYLQSLFNYLKAFNCSSSIVEEDEF